MKTLRPLVLLIVPVVLAAPGEAAEVPAAVADPVAAKAPASPALSPRFKQVRERIDALFHYRNEPPPVPDARGNPFRPAGPALEPRPPLPVDDLPPGGPLNEAPISDLTRLQESVATIRVSGTVEKDGRLYIVINSKAYKDDDVVQTVVQGETVYLRVRQISRREVTVVLDGAEMTLRF